MGNLAIVQPQTSGVDAYSTDNAQLMSFDKALDEGLVNDMESAGFTQKDADDAYKAFVAVVTDALKKGEDVALAGFGTFKVKAKAARKGINPKTKEQIDKDIKYIFIIFCFKDSFSPC